jgi:CHAT domain-containing protein
VAQLPFAVLVTAPYELDPDRDRTPLFASYRNVPWLARRVAITQVPSIASFVTLRALPPGPAARRAFAGFGDPWFDARRGPAGAARPEAGTPAPDADAVAARGVALARRSAPGTRTAESAALAQLAPLPETAEEVRQIASVLGADPARDVFLGRQANEQVVRTTDLSDRRVVMFATHGLVPGELDGLTEPALALTAPEVAGVPGDGLLTMGKILGLKLDADWVVLSACNTAAGDGAGAEAISGLGRAFFYAGTRALLVSNWPVETTSAAALTTDLFRRQAGGEAAGRAEALRQSMLALMDGPGFVRRGRTVFTYAHPIFWAPFTVVGD